VYTVGSFVKDSERINTGPASCPSSRREESFIDMAQASKFQWFNSRVGCVYWRWGWGNLQTSSCKENSDKESRNQFKCGLRIITVEEGDLKVATNITSEV
jgi:hypothetical protein